MFKTGDRVVWFDNSDRTVQAGTVDSVYEDGTMQITLDSEDIVTVDQKDCEVE